MALTSGSRTRFLSNPVNVCRCLDSPRRLLTFLHRPCCSTATTATIKMSGFADLPRELRDIIYEMYMVDMIRQQPARGQSALITKAPILVCHKQFGREAALVSTPPCRSLGIAC